MNFDSFIAVLGVFGSGNNHFRISISNLKQRRAFSLKCFLPGNTVADLNIKLLAASLSNKVDFLLIELADINIVSTAKKLDANDVFISFATVNRCETGKTQPTYKALRTKKNIAKRIILISKQILILKEVASMSKTININNRRYLGNKYKLLPFIKKVVDTECSDIEVVVDIFSGTGAVASAFQDKQLITNDIMYSNYICNLAWFSPRKYSRKKLEKIIDAYNSMDIQEENYMTQNFSDTYFCHDDCAKIGYIREDIEKKYENKEINKRERALLITSLLYAMDKIAKTCGHYDAYRQGVEFDMHLELSLPEASTTNNKKNKCYNIDSNILAGKITSDLVYIDPPYNSRQYCDAYHLLENVARWEKPEVFGVAKKWIELL